MPDHVKGDLIAQEDQAKESAKTTASIVSAFYSKLIADKMDVVTARYLTKRYYEKISAK